MVNERQLVYLNRKNRLLLDIFLTVKMRSLLIYELKILFTFAKCFITTPVKKTK